MTEPSMRFSIFILASLLVFVALLKFALRRRNEQPSLLSVCMISAIVVVGGMLFAKLANNAGWPWWIYYTIPAGVTLLLPPLSFRLSLSELWQYLLLAFLSSPVIHLTFSFFLGWHEYMPFLRVASLRELIG